MPVHFNLIFFINKEVRNILVVRDGAILFHSQSLKTGCQNSNRNKVLVFSWFWISDLAGVNNSPIFRVARRTPSDQLDKISWIRWCHIDINFEIRFKPAVQRKLCIVLVQMLLNERLILSYHTRWIRSSYVFQ